MSLQSEEMGGPEGAISTTPAAPSKAFARGVVRVNLIPAEIAEARAVRVTAVAMAGAAVLSLAVVGLLYHQQSSQLATANTQLAAAQTEHTQLVAEQSRLGDVDTLYAKVDAAQAMLTQAQAPQVLWSRYLEDLRLQLPEHVWLSSLTASETGTSTAAATASAPVAGAATLHPTTGTATTPAASAIGTLNFAGSAYTHNDVADLLDRLSGLRGVSDPYLASSTQSLVGSGANALPTVTWSLTAGLTSDALKSAYTSATTAAGEPTP